MAYDLLEPIGDLRGDYQAASVCSVIANIAAGQSGSNKRFRVQDFMLEFGNEREIPQAESAPTQTWQEQKMIGMMFASIS